MLGWFKPGQRAGLAIEPLGKTRPARGLGRQDFQRDQPVQRGLAGLIDRAHAALADESENLQLRKQARHLLQAGRLEGHGLRRRPGFRALFEQAGRAKPLQRAAGQRRAALGALVWHVFV